MQTTACPASGQKRKEGLGLDVKRGEEIWLGLGLGLGPISIKLFS